MHSEITKSGITSPTGSTSPQDSHARRQPRPGPTFYGLPCVNCKLYYAAELAVCPICGCGARISPVIWTRSHVDATAVHRPLGQLVSPGEEHT